jgi:hypothetical protein
MEKLVLGDGFQEGVTQGPLINLSQFKKVNTSVADPYLWLTDPTPDPDLLFLSVTFKMATKNYFF